jgi:hypothetical protein
LRDVSTSLATNGAAAIESGTIVDFVPIAVPTISLESGNRRMMRIMNGKERSTLTILLSTSFRTGFGLSPPWLAGLVMQRRIPKGSPRRTENSVERETI